MTAETRELLRLSLLKLAARVRGAGLIFQSFHDSARLLIPDLKPQQTRDMLTLLDNDGLLARLDGQLGASLARWIITGDGLAHLIQTGAAE